MIHVNEQVYRIGRAGFRIRPFSDAARVHARGYSRTLQRIVCDFGAEHSFGAHRYVIQKRLKLSGAWWLLQHAKNMINLRTCRANHLWDDYWKKIA